MTEVLAWEPTADEVARNSREGSNVVMARDIWPVSPEDELAVWVVLNELDGSHASSLKSEAEPSNAAEEVEDTH